MSVTTNVNIPKDEGNVSIASLKQVIFSNTPSFFYLNKIVNLIGDLLAVSGNIAHGELFMFSNVF